MILSKKMTCGFCNNIAKMEIIGTVSDLTTDVNPEFGPVREYGIFYEINRCPKCEKANIIKYNWHDGIESEDEVLYEILYPINKEIPLGMPDNIKSIYHAAEKVKSIDVNAYAILMRRLLEMVCLNRKAKGKILAKMLQDLANRNEIPVKLVKVAKGLKDFGNVGAHAGIGELTKEEIPIIAMLTRAVLEYIYSAPYLATLAENKLNSIKKKR